MKRPALSSSIGFRPQTACDKNSVKEYHHISNTRATTALEKTKKTLNKPNCDDGTQ